MTGKTETIESGEAALIDVVRALSEEYAAVTGASIDQKSQDLQSIQRAHFAEETAALCLSGGGIRSAAFSLGVVQGLAQRGLLKRFQYLSTVSGGGYIGCFLAAWAYRAKGGIREVEEQMANAAPKPLDPLIAANPLDWLRRNSNYLSPRTGFSSLDAWTLIATYLRNLLLNSLVTVPLLAALICIPFVFYSLITGPHLSRDWITNLAIIGLTFTVGGLLVLRWRTYSRQKPRSTRVSNNWYSAVAIAIFLGAICVTVARNSSILSNTALQPGSSTTWIGVTILALVLCNGLFLLFDQFSDVVRSWSESSILAIATIVSAFVLIYSVSSWLIVSGAWIPDGQERYGSNVLMAIFGVPSWIIILLIPEVIFLAIASGLSDDLDREWWARSVAILLLLSSIWFGFGTLVLGGPLAFGFLIGETQRANFPALIGSLAALLSGILSRGIFIRSTTRPAKIGERDDKKRSRTEPLQNVIGAILIVIVIAGMAYYVKELLIWSRSLLSYDQFCSVGVRPCAFGSLLFSIWQRSPLVELLVVAAFLGVSFLFGITINVNRYSLHSMYRDRLVRSFLAASRGKRIFPAELDEATLVGTRPAVSRIERILNRFLGRASEPPPEMWQFTAREGDEFTEFDKHDSPRMQWLNPARRGGVCLRGNAGAEQFETEGALYSQAPPNDESVQQVEPDHPPAIQKSVDASTSGLGAAEDDEFIRAPMLIVNCALNRVGDRDNAVQERKATSFTISPLHAGSADLGYRQVSSYGGPEGISLGTAMTISGAAVSPNAGRRTSLVTAFLLTLFNARLGWWLGNPNHELASKSAGPSNSFDPLVRELFGLTDYLDKWIYVSDGGHFENLGIYEMVRRGCRYIVAVDASADHERNFDDLGNAIRKIRIDFGIEIRQSPKSTFEIGAPELGEDGRYAALFDIIYPGNDEPGQLLYVKTATYLGNSLAAPMDVFEYGNRSQLFPHEPTSDQFFMESQFESYRALGEHEIDAIMLINEENIKNIFDGALEHIRDPYD